MAEVLNVTQDTFQSEVLESDKTALVDFWADWCGPCHIMSPVVDEIASEMPDVKVCKVDVDTQAALAKQFKILGIPTLLVFKEGKLANRIVGVTPKEAIVAVLKE